ncbi:MAG: sigma E protease regulator RseP [Thalassotalea sp.]
MFEFFWNISAFIVAIGVLVTFHEYGHFWVARKCGVKVERFSIGFGKPLWKKKDRFGTEFVLAAIPLGGYVKMLDERVDEVAPEDKDKTFNSKSVYQRIAIIAAGPMANFLLAFVAFYFAFLIGSPAVKPVIGKIIPASIAEQAQLPSGHQIIEVAGRTVFTWQDVNLALVTQIGNAQVNVKTKSFDSQYQHKSTLDLSAWQYQPEDGSALTSLGITPFYPKGTCRISAVSPNSAADLAGMMPDDIIHSLNGERQNQYCEDFTKQIQSLPEQNVVLLVERNGAEKELMVKLDVSERNGQKIGLLGVGIAREAWPENHRFELKYGFFESIEKSLNKTWNVTVSSFEMIGKLITGNISAKNLSGPIGIAQGAGNSAGVGFVYFLGFIAFFSINLGLFNLLPLPVLDGGHLLYYLIELLTGKPVPEKFQEIGFKFGAIALLSLMAFAILNDISRL